MPSVPIKFDFPVIFHSNGLLQEFSIVTPLSVSAFQSTHPNTAYMSQQSDPVDLLGCDTRELLAIQSIELRERDVEVLPTSCLPPGRSYIHVRGLHDP